MAHRVGTYSAPNYTFEFKREGDNVLAEYYHCQQLQGTYRVDPHTVQILAPADITKPIHEIVTKLLAQQCIPSVQGGILGWTLPPDGSVARVEYHLSIAIQHMRVRNYADAVASLLEGQRSAAAVLDPIGEANFLEKLDRGMVQELVEKTHDPRIEFLLLQKDAVRRSFEMALEQLSTASTQEKKPNCFICFSSEPDVVQWLEKTFVFDLDIMGIELIFCFRQYGPGRNLNRFQQRLRHADSVIIICTHDLKKKCEERADAPFGVVQEISLAENRIGDPQRSHSTYAIYLKGNVRTVCPSSNLESCFAGELTLFENSTIHKLYSYYEHAFEIFGAIRNIARPTSKRALDAFIITAQQILRDRQIDRAAVANWFTERVERRRVVEAQANSVVAHDLDPNDHIFFTNLKNTLQKIRDEITTNEYRQMERSLYIESDCVSGFVLSDSETRKPLRQAFESFMAGPKKVMLLQAFAGSGKTMFTQEIEQDLLAKLDLHNPESRIPLRIELGGLTDPVRGALSEGLRNKGFTDDQIARLKEMPVLIILDGVDEARFEGKRLSPTHHLFFTNKIYEWKKAKVLFGLRIGGGGESKVNVNQFRPYSSDSNQSIQPPNLLEGVVICPFSENKIGDYISQYVRKAPAEWKNKFPEWSNQGTSYYLRMIRAIQGAIELAKVPFNLRLLTEFLPPIVNEAMKNSRSFDATALKITESQIYEVFLTHWFDREQQKLVGQNLPDEFYEADPSEFAWSYCMRLAQAMSFPKQGEGVTQVVYRNADLFPSDPSRSWDPFFSGNPVQIICKRLAPLKRAEQGNQSIYSFIHPYIQDFLVARLSRLQGDELGGNS